ncbi:uncharacterized protein Gasu_13480 [Galdieria sulphuraria]|uniref:Uncharacterized protein n=1 Tax=Galdieria sulphuraria TaxID=130081 RepID=M2Y6B2_GALSU|nr:uncharacterized protein Gasu_13480 [Galdieria sulphuraria]EME31384.1 hypothetical protein Gasu_13480 [Galdieria sulphuraria]|eukprot:XP_005707904.1 hypothetical protein Gasu_13480 [Galdieria sulphuraria]
MSLSWLRSIFVSPLLESLNYFATQEHFTFAGDTSILLLKQTQSRKHAFVVEVDLKAHTLWISDGSFTVSSVITEEAARHLEQDSEYVSVAQLRLGEIILRKFDLVLEHLKNNWKPKIVIHQFYYKGEIFAPLENSLDLERDPTVGHLIETFSKVMLEVGNYKREAVFLLSGLWKQAFESSRRWRRFATCNDILKLGKFVEETAFHQVENGVENSIPSFSPCYDGKPVSSTTIKQECYELNKDDDEWVTMMATAQPNSQSFFSPESPPPSSFEIQETNENDDTQRVQSANESWTHDGIDQLEEYEHLANISTNLSHFPDGKEYLTQRLQERQLSQPFSAFRSEVDISPVDDILSKQHHSQNLEIVKNRKRFLR